jgi:hypothetical protein
MKEIRTSLIDVLKHVGVRTVVAMALDGDRVLLSAGSKEPHGRLRLER